MCCTDGDFDNIIENQKQKCDLSVFWICYLHKMESHYFSLLWLFYLLLWMSYTPDSKSHTKHNEKEWNPIHHKILLVIIISESERTEYFASNNSSWKPMQIQGTWDNSENCELRTLIVPAVWLTLSKQSFFEPHSSHL